MAELTPSQTIGPFFHEATRWMVGTDVDLPGTVLITGRVLDAEGSAVNDALLEIAFGQPFGSRQPIQRVFSDEAGAFGFRMPTDQVAHVTIFARGLLRHLFTRVYLDPGQVPSAVPAARRGTLVALPAGTTFVWDVRLRGDSETVFFDLG